MGYEEIDLLFRAECRHGIDAGARDKGLYRMEGKEYEVRLIQRPVVIHSMAR